MDCCAGIKDPSKVSESANLAELGMDSLMGAEIKQTLERGYDVVLGVHEIRALTFARLKEMSGGAAAAAPAADPAAPAAASAAPAAPAAAPAAPAAPEPPANESEELVQFATLGELIPKQVQYPI